MTQQGRSNHNRSLSGVWTSLSDAAKAWVGQSMAHRVLSAAALLVVFVLSVIVLRFPSHVATYARIHCGQEWVLVRGQDGQLSASVFNHETGVSEGFRASNFDRGTSVQFNLSPFMIPGHTVSQGDTIGIVSSSETQERLVALNGQLAAARSLLAVDSSGEKSAVVHAAAQRLIFARRKAKESEKSFQRSKALYSQGLLPTGLYEEAENFRNAANDEVAMAAAALDEARTGAKPEQLQFVNSNISALEQEIAALQRRAATHTIVSPISGRVGRGSSDTLLVIGDTSRYVATMPVRLDDVMRVAATHSARVTLRGLSRTVHGTVVSIDQEVNAVGVLRIVMVTAVLDGVPAEPVLGLPVRCDIACRPESALALARRFLHSLVA